MSEEHPAYVPQRAIDEVRERCDTNDIWIPPTENRFRTGQQVRIKQGALAGLFGVFEGMVGQREVALLSMLGRAARAEFKIGDLVAA